jgi:addiction module HigA family antidote
MTIRIEDAEDIELSDVSQGDRIPLSTPGELLRREFMEPFGLSANALAAALKVPTNRITSVINGTRGITADTALRLARYFGTTAEFWLNLQKGHELRVARRDAGPRIRQDVSPRSASPDGRPSRAPAPDQP